MTITPDGKSLVEVDPVNETITEIKKIPELFNSFGGHRYWAYDDQNDRFFVIGLDATNESYLYVLDSNNGNILFQHIYEDDVWIMEEHSPLELRYNPSTEQLLGLRKGDPLPVSIQHIKKNNNDFKLFPNPIIDQALTIESLNGENMVEIQVLNTEGKMVYKMEEANASLVQLNLNEFVPGMYYVVIKTELHQYYQKVLAQ